MPKPENHGTVHIAKPAHEVAYQDLANLLKKHAEHLTGLELLAVGANMVGKLMALQDQRKVTRDMAIKTILANIEMGNQHLVQNLVDGKGGSA